jgi:multidrug resistance efflux pump
MSADGPPPFTLLGPGRHAVDLGGAMPALRLVRAPLAVRRVALALLLLFPALLLGLAVLPWQQSAVGKGEVIAFAPEERLQTVEAPIKGTISSWQVGEGDLVEAGQVLAILVDNDPEFFARLEAERAQVEVQLEAAREQVRTYRLKAEAERTARDLAVAEYAAKVLSEEQKLLGELADAEAAALQARRVGTLEGEGIESRRTLELARASEAKAQAAADARLRVIQGSEAARDKARRAGDSKVASAEAELQAALAKEADSRQKLLAVDVKLARQARQELRAPRAGRVLRLLGGRGGAQVKEGDVLVTLVPETASRAVALKVDGNDMPLIQPGEHVRLLFEGWPALQFSGWPGLGFGTFGGTVAFIDATDDGEGSFRLVVVPDPDDRPWPPAERLRQGVQARGFVMLRTVPLGYELWRQINGFPSLPPVEKGEKVTPPNQKKPRAPAVLQ